jgi:hypothetical protein
MPDGEVAVAPKAVGAGARADPARGWLMSRAKIRATAAPDWRQCLQQLDRFQGIEGFTQPGSSVFRVT